MQEIQAVSNTLPTLSTVKNLPSCFPLLELTAAAIHGHIFKAADRFDSKGRKIPTNNRVLLFAGSYRRHLYIVSK
jgi:hypothetical protein